MLSQVVVVYHSGDSLRSWVICSRRPTKAEVLVIFDPLRQVAAELSHVLSLSGPLCKVVALTLSFAHGFKVQNGGVLQVVLDPSSFVEGSLPLGLELGGIKWVQVSSSLLCKLREVSERDVLLLASVQIFENSVDLVDLVLDPEMVEPLLELIERDSVVEVDVEVSIGLSHPFEALIQLDPEKV